jgi:Tol biopolymer transport system component
MSSELLTKPFTSPSISSEAQGAEGVRLREGMIRICRSAEFSRSKRMIALLRFLLEAYNSGDLSALNERAIGIAVFDRPADWDPSTDTIVRSEVRRLRAKLQAYYVGLGEHDELRIDIPKGGYAPKVSFLDAPKITPISNAAARPYIYWLVVLMALGSIGVFLQHRSTVQADVRIYKVVPFTSDLGQEFSPSISPAGDRIAYVAHVDGHGTRIFIKGIDSREPTAFTAPDGVYLFPSWAPDGHALAYLRVEADHVSVLTRTIDGTAERVVTTIAKEIGRWSDQPMQLVGNPGPVWAKEGTRLVIADHTPTHTGLSLVDSDGTHHPLTVAPGESRDFCPRISPDGTQVAFVRYYSHGTADIYLVPLSGGTVHQVTNEAHAIQGIAWDFDGKSLIASSNRDGSYALWRFPLSGSASAIPISAVAPTEPAVSPTTGAIAYVESSENWNIWRSSLSAGTLGKPGLFLSSSGRNYDPRYSPDGKRVAFVSDRSGSMQIWLVDAAGTKAVQATSLSGSWMGGLTWSPDSRTLAFDARPQGHAAIFLLDVLSGKVQTLFDNNFEERMPSFSGDGRALYFNSTRSGDVDIWRYDLQTHALSRLPLPTVFTASETTDGTGLIYGTRSGALFRSSSVTAAPDEWKGVVADPALSWFVASSGVYFSRRTANAHFELCRATQSKTECLGQLPGILLQNGPDIALSPDGQSLLFAQEDSSSGDIKIGIQR